jgi:eukaryotic-like serine/threonine-protein kinase
VIPGDVLGKKYELEARLGKGGMGEVWRARHVETNEHVAVKVLLDELAQDSALQKRFLREARAAAAVKHPNVVELREVQEGDDGAPFLVMELLEGETLGRRLKRLGALSTAETAAIMLPVLDAVDAAHAAHVVHRDLKPENIFLARERDDSVRVRVLDFGIAKRVEKLAAPTTSATAETTAAPATTGAMLGTPYYMAPEQALGERDVDGLADIWSLGVMLYECLAGRRPTEAATLGAILKIIVTDGVVPLWEVLPGVEGSLAAAVMRMLRTSRAERAPSLDEIRTVLVEHLDPAFVLEASIGEQGRASQAHEPATPGGKESAGARTRPAQTSRRRWLGALAIGAATVAIGVIAARTFGPGEATAPLPAEAASRSATPASASPPATDAPLTVAASSTTTSPTTTSLTPPNAPSPARPRTSAPRSAAPTTTTTTTPTTTPTPTAPQGPGRGPSGLVTDNPFAPSPSLSAPRP